MSWKANVLLLLSSSSLLLLPSLLSLLLQLSSSSSSLLLLLLILLLLILLLLLLLSCLTWHCRCKTLDASADGYVRAEAVGCAILVPASAVPEGLLPGLVLLSGSAVNQDGRSSSLTAPNGPSQQGVIRQALQAGNLDWREVSQLQMHGTGTPLGGEQNWTPPSSRFSTAPPPVCPLPRTPRLLDCGMMSKCVICSNACPCASMLILLGNTETHILQSCCLS